MFYVSDLVHGAIWRCGFDGSLARVLGQWSGEPDRPRSAAGLALALDGALLVADSSGHRIWRVAPDSACCVLAGDFYGYRDGGARDALFRFPTGVAVGPDGTCYVADTGNDKIRTISPDGHVATLAGSIFTFADGQGAATGLRRPSGLAFGREDIFAVADTGNNAIRLVAADGTVTTLAGSPPGGSADGIGERAGLQAPSAIACCERSRPMGEFERAFVCRNAPGPLRWGRHRTGASWCLRRRVPPLVRRPWLPAWMPRDRRSARTRQPMRGDSETHVRLEAANCTGAIGVGRDGYRSRLQL